MSQLDKNFDGIADRFESRIYGSLKGKIRQAILWRDLNELLSRFPNKPLRILDVGAGLGDIAIELACRGHQVFYNDISQEMFDKAQSRAAAANIDTHLVWSNQPYQNYIQSYLQKQPKENKFDLILCHALLEWLEQPELLIPALKSILKPTGHLSLCFYNPSGLIFRNLIYGNFKLATTVFDMKPDTGSLTPRQASTSDKVKHWLEQNDFSIHTASGIRVFSDYAMHKRGGNAIPDEVIKMELEFSRKEEFIWVARYIHLLCENNL